MICTIDINFYTEKTELQNLWCNFLPLPKVVSSVKTVTFIQKRYNKVLTITIL